MGTPSTGTISRRHRLGSRITAAAAAAVVLGLALGCTAVSDADASTTDSMVTEETGVDRYLAPYANTPEGAMRKVGSDWYERTDGGWVEAEAR
jgi:nitrous oxide reductase